MSVDRIRSTLLTRLSFPLHCLLAGIVSISLAGCGGDDGGSDSDSDDSSSSNTGAGGNQTASNNSGGGMGNGGMDPNAMMSDPSKMMEMAGGDMGEQDPSSIGGDPTAMMQNMAEGEGELGGDEALAAAGGGDLSDPSAQFGNLGEIPEAGGDPGELAGAGATGSTGEIPQAGGDPGALAGAAGGGAIPGAGGDPGALAGAAGGGAIPGAGGEPGALAGEPGAGAAGIPGAPGGIPGGGEGGGGRAQAPPEGSPEYPAYQLVMALRGGKFKGVEKWISARARGNLASIRSGKLSPAAKEGLKKTFANPQLVGKPRSARGGRQIVLRNGNEIITILVKKEAGGFKVAELSTRKTKR